MTFKFNYNNIVLCILFFQNNLKTEIKLLSFDHFKYDKDAAIRNIEHKYLIKFSCVVFSVNMQNDSTILNITAAFYISVIKVIFILINVNLFSLSDFQSFQQHFSICCEPVSDLVCEI